MLPEKRGLQSDCMLREVKHPSQLELLAKMDRTSLHFAQLSACSFHRCQTHLGRRIQYDNIPVDRTRRSVSSQLETTSQDSLSLCTKSILRRAFEDQNGQAASRRN
jgi:hypothetical protein